MGWIGASKQVEYALHVVGADKDEDGRYLIYNEMPSSFLGLGEELVVPDATSYSIDGQKRSLAGLLGSTSYGLSVTVL